MLSGFILPRLLCSFSFLFYFVELNLNALICRFMPTRLFYFLSCQIAVSARVIACLDALQSFSSLVAF